jgi:RNA-directed DNA polymerase
VSAWPLLDALRRALGRAREPYPFEAAWADLLERLGLPAAVLGDVGDSGSLRPHFAYRRFTKPKRGGGRRDIAEPDRRLKRVQEEIAGRHLGEEPHPAALAYRPGRSIADHAWAHAGAAWVVTADVADFFPATAAWRVGRWWDGRVDADESRALTRLTTDRGGLPQGAPTSPALSNLVNRELDERLARRAGAAGARYTRYCDDLAFSWRSGAGPRADFEAGVRSALAEAGYVLHREKGWRVHGPGAEPEVTGVILTRDGRVRLPDRLRRTMRALARSRDPRDVWRLEGYRAYEVMVTRPPT